MPKLRKCPKCNSYTLKNSCTTCKKPTKNAHYKFVKIRDAPRTKESF